MFHSASSWFVEENPFLMELHKVDVGQPIQTVDDFLLYIFSTIDTDNGGNMLALLRSRWCLHLT